MIYSWLLFGLVAFDTFFTLIAIKYFGAIEANPLMASMLAQSILLFIAFKLGTVGGVIYLGQRSGKPGYVKFGFWLYFLLYVGGMLGTNIPAHVTPRHKVTASTSKQVWRPAVITVYAQKFEGRRMANGQVFRHRNQTVACRGGTLGSWIELRYGCRGRSICKLTDRGRLPMHTASRPQFDVSRGVARDLGLYDQRYGRSIRWRYIRKVGK